MKIQSKVSLEKPLFLREVLNRTYSVSAYFWGKSASDMPFHLLYPILSCSITYFLVGLNTEPISRFFCLSKNYLFILFEIKHFYSWNWGSLFFYRSVLWFIAFSSVPKGGNGNVIGSHANRSIHVVCGVFRKPK